MISLIISALYGAFKNKFMKLNIFGENHDSELDMSVILVKYFSTLMLISFQLPQIVNSLNIIKLVNNNPGLFESSSAKLVSFTIGAIQFMINIGAILCYIIATDVFSSPEQCIILLGICIIILNGPDFYYKVNEIKQFKLNYKIRVV